MAQSRLVITTRGLRVVYTLEAIAVGGIALIAGGIGAAGGGGDSASAAPAWAGLPPGKALAAAPCPDPESIDLHGANDREIAAAEKGRFDVFGPKPTHLSVPVDWSTDPLDAHRYRQNLQKLRFIEPLLVSYQRDGNVDDLAEALDYAVDWVRQNPRGDPSTPIEAWSDKVVGDRVPLFAYLLRAAACERAGSAADRRKLAGSVIEHGKLLASGGLHSPDNHGLFVDLGLIELSNQLPFLKQSPHWRQKARTRFERTLRGRLADGYWLEHSTSYQFLAIRALERMMAAWGPDPVLSDLQAQMHAAAGWMIEPDGQMSQFGDSDQEKVPDWAAAETDEAGLHTAPDAGFAFVRAPEPDGGYGYLAVTSGFHNTTHKHADELSFELYDHGERIVSDTGLYDKDPGPVRDFVVSNRAHSTVTVDGQQTPIGDASKAYGSGLEASGSGDGWYAIQATNKLLKGQGVRAQRLFLYRPGQALVVIDRLRSDATHAYTRYLQLGPEIGISPSRDEVGIAAGDLDGAIYDLSPGERTTRTQARGQKDPMQGYTSPSFRKLVPRWTLAYATDAANATLTSSIALDRGRLRATSVDASGKSADVQLTDGGGNERTLTVTRDGETLAVSDPDA